LLAQNAAQKSLEQARVVQPYREEDHLPPPRLPEMLRQIVKEARSADDLVLQVTGAEVLLEAQVQEGIGRARIDQDSGLITDGLEKSLAVLGAPSQLAQGRGAERQDLLGVRLLAPLAMKPVGQR